LALSLSRLHLTSFRLGRVVRHNIEPENLINNILYQADKYEFKKAKKWGKIYLKTLPREGCLSVQITSKFIADLKWLADFPERLKEYNEMGKGS
jgi:hypothetical protein